MSINPMANNIRAKKLGLLVYDARISSRRTIDECAQAIGVSPERFHEYEAGIQSPSLPEIELLAFFLKIQIEHFWGRSSIFEKKTESVSPQVDRLVHLRQRMIGIHLQQARLKADLSIETLADKAEINPEDLQEFETGDVPVPLPILDHLAQILGEQINLFMDQHGPIATWMAQQQTIQSFLGLPMELQEFIGKPVNRPYLELAQRLNELSVEKLRTIAESLLEITY
jgi:transcriptional regulator with XRE-family HTH domain